MNNEETCEFVVGRITDLPADVTAGERIMHRHNVLVALQMFRRSLSEVHPVVLGLEDWLNRHA
jgi:hypothetical protein